ncbi:MAG: hypothetical protein QM728_11690 [Gordonia sp. (in: high G+C Gram-positive bacteria)]|uniref:hypothetical protein n=1 Tax=Gordonia sp. (in: high G+C Gram-positive bacteria) TaxID=84139 RepID=UPI0039E68204
MGDITADQARAALDAADRAQRRVTDEIGLPRLYWWIMAAAWIVLGILGDVGPAAVATGATILFAFGHIVLATRYLDGRSRSDQVQVSGRAVSRRIPWLVTAILVGLVAVTIAAGFALDADGARHAGIWASVFAAAIVGFGGPEILATLRRWTRS